MTWKVKIYLSKDKEDWLYLVDEKTLEPKVFDDWTDAQVAAHLWSYSDIEEVRRGEDRHVDRLDVDEGEGLAVGAGRADGVAVRADHDLGQFQGDQRLVLDDQHPSSVQHRDLRGAGAGESASAPGIIGQSVSAVSSGQSCECIGVI